jgi:hypothetical protein
VESLVSGEETVYRGKTVKIRWIVATQGFQPMALPDERIGHKNITNLS